MEIHWRDFAGLAAEEKEAIESRLQALAAERGDLIDLRIAGHETAHHRHGDRSARISGNLLGKEIVAVQSAADLRLALDLALDAFEGEVRKRRGRVGERPRPREGGLPHLGIVDRVFQDRGYGFILTDGGERVYFHRHAVREPLAFERLGEGERVALNLEAGEEGLQATAVATPPPDAVSP